jgi:hypothetical protein
MEVAAFAKAVGGKIAHVTASSNLESIHKSGLQSASSIARNSGKSPQDIVLRSTRTTIGNATLNHQLTIVHGLVAAHKMLDDHTPETWAEQLDERVFFWPRAKGVTFSKSIQKDISVSTLWLDARRFAEVFWDQIDLSPINSGNFRQGGANAERGDWLYCPLSAGLKSFRQNRRARKLIARNDGIEEISLRSSVSPDVLAQLLCDP